LQSQEYNILRDKALKTIPDNVDLFKIKQEFRHLIPAKRRFERISSILQLIQELERQLIIFPDKKGIQQFYNIVRMVNALQPNTVGPDLILEITQLTQRLEPLQALRSRNVSTSSNFSQDPSLFTRVPDNIKAMLARELERTEAGQDWEHFATGLGEGLKEKDKIRVKQGEVDRIEREHNGNVERILYAVVTKFEDKCIQNRINVKMIDHIIDVLKSERIFGGSFYKKLASEIKAEQKKLENHYPYV